MTEDTFLSSKRSKGSTVAQGLKNAKNTTTRTGEPCPDSEVLERDIGETGAHNAMAEGDRVAHVRA